MIFAANWKLNLGPKASSELLGKIAEALPKEVRKSVYIFPQNLSLPSISEQAKATGINFGAQNIYSQSTGAFTGENSVEALLELGANTCLIGHSERRSLFSEDEDLLAAKLELSIEKKMIPILCIGESLKDREAGSTNTVLEQQLSSALSDVSDTSSFLIAYEPVWAIGTGKVASPEMAEETHEFIRSWLKTRFSEKKAASTAILYGGSVKPDNAGALSSQMNIDGFLIGGASLKAESFLEIVRNSRGDA